MRSLLEFLFRNPFLALIVAIWLASAIGNVLRSQRQGRDRGARRPLPPAPRPQQPPEQQAEQVAREMRRILGIEPSPTPIPAPPPPAPPVDLEPQRRRVLPQERHLPIHVDPHVGASIRGRSLRAGSDRPRRPRGELGSLGARVQHKAARVASRRRFALDDLKRIVVLSEILAPPVGLRPFEDRRPV